MVLAAGQGAEVAPQGALDVESEIRASLEAWTTAYAEGDVETLVGLFTADGVYLSNTGQLMVGHEAIREGVRGFLALRERFFRVLGVPDSTLRVEQEWVRFRHTRDSAHVLGRFRVLVEPQNCVMDAGEFLAVWLRPGDVEWRIDTLMVTQVRTPPEDSCLGG